jgi:hypothetical protein
MPKHRALQRQLSCRIVCSAVDEGQIHVGDIGVAHSKGLVARLIRVFTRSKWNHCCVIVETDGTRAGTWVVQAEAHGVGRAKFTDVAPGGYVHVLPCPVGIDGIEVAALADTLLDTPYAFLVVFSDLINLFPLPAHLQIMRTGTLMCSAVVALCLFHAGYTNPAWTDLYAVRPDQVADALAS